MIRIKYKTHNIGGLFLGTLFIGIFLESILIQFKLVDISIASVIYIYSLLVGSVFPDIDHEQSYISNRLKLLSSIVRSKFKHRGFTHSLLIVYFLLLFGLVFNIILKLFYSELFIDFHIYILAVEYGFFIGYISHLFFDMFNPTGICLLYPSSKRYRLPLSPIIKFGSLLEYSLGRFLYVLTFILFCIYSYVLLLFIFQ